MLTAASPEDRSFLHLHHCRRDSAAEVRYKLTGDWWRPSLSPGPGLGPTPLRSINLPLSRDWDFEQNSVLGESQPGGVAVVLFQIIHKWLQTPTTERC